MEECKHQWKEKERKKQVKNSMPPGFFHNGFIQYEMKILQECEKCGKYNVVVY